MPNKREIKVLGYLNKVDSRYVNNKRGDLEENIKKKLGITNSDIGDMHYSKFLDFGQVSITSGLKNVISITHEGSAFIEDYFYQKMKEVFYWIFGIASIAAAIFAAWTVFK
jgi:hypothetical protein